MKTFKLIPFAVLAAAALLLASCQKENISEPATASRLVTLTDQSGKNTVTLRLSADAALLDQTDWTTFVSLEPVFQAPDIAAFNEPSEALEIPAAGAQEVRMELMSQQLEPGAVGVTLRFRGNADAAAERWQWVTTFTTSYDRVKVTTNYNCHDVYYYKRPYSYSGFSLMAAFFNRCSPGSWTSASSIPSYQMQAKIYYNSNTSFGITAW